MSRSTPFVHSGLSRQRITVAFLVAFVCCGLPIAWGAGLPIIGTGEVVANDVYVRSGDSLNHYTVCKLNAGARVTVVSESGDWYEILPPEGTFSLVSGDYVTVDVRNPGMGVINGEGVRVRAGSELNKSKYTVQTKLSKGAEVKLIKRNDDGFYRIEPPDGATLWISRSYVEMVPDGRLAVGVVDEEADGNTGNPGFSQGSNSSQGKDSLQGKVPAETNGKSAERNPGESVDPSSDVNSGEGDASTGPAAGDSIGDTTKAELLADRNKLKEIDVKLQSEIEKPVADRSFEGIQSQLRQIAESTDDEVARKYAEVRLSQLDRMISVTEAAARLRDIDRSTKERRTQLLQQRTELPQIKEVRKSPFDAFGEFRRSAVYSDGVGPTRFRLVDRHSEDYRTVAYVELDEGLSIDVTEFLGRFVGVRASSKRLLPGGVDAVPILVAVEIRPVDPALASGKQASEE